MKNMKDFSNKFKIYIKMIYYFTCRLFGKKGNILGAGAKMSKISIFLFVLLKKSVTYMESRRQGC